MKPEQKPNPTPNISTVNKDEPHSNSDNSNNGDKAVIKTIKIMHDITRTGYSGPGVKKFNQDNFFIYKNFNNNPNSIYFGVW